ncbi:MAG: hypothetical protein K0S16_174 [Moraxellaceae bacterium]|nr:hypothetical protein [Moraxellaceae bacterium]
MAARSSADPRRALALLALLVPAGASALEALDDAGLAAVEGGDGITTVIGNPGSLSLNQLRWHTDNAGAAPGACTGGIANRQACTLLGGTLSGADGNPLALTATLDAFSSAGVPGLGLAVNWQPQLLRLNTLTFATPTVDYSSRTLGQVGLYSQGGLSLRNSGGVFNSSGNTALLDFSATGDLIYRQGGAGSPELSFGNLSFSNRFTSGAAASHATAAGLVGIDLQGLLFSAPYTRSELLFDLMFKSAPTDFDRSGRSPMIKFGWSGGLVNPQVRVMPGGIGYGTYTSGSSTLYDISGSNGGGARSEGLNVSASWDFDSDFAFVLGQAGGNGTQARMTNWRRMATVPTSTPMLTMPITLDVLQNGVGPAGLCFGGGFTSGSPVQGSCTAAGGTWVGNGLGAGEAAFAVMIRDGRLHAYNQQIEVRDPASANPVTVYDWSLLYTFGKLDADILLTPEGRNPGAAVTTNAIGLRADVTLAAQSPGYWQKANSASAATRATAGTGWATNTHFMLADTKVGGVAGQQYGVGIVNADLLWVVRDMYFRVLAGDSAYPLIPAGLWMQTDTGASYRFRGLLGGGNLQDLSAPTGVALIDLNLATSRFIFALNPTAPVAGDAPIGFNGLLDFDGTAYLSLGEISNPSAAFRLYDVVGRVGWKNGSVNLVSGQNTADGLPKLAIANELLFGSSANFTDPGAAVPTGGGAALVGKAGFGSENFGRIALPAGTWHSDVSIKIPGS